MGNEAPPRVARVVAASAALTWSGPLQRALNEAASQNLSNFVVAHARVPLVADQPGLVPVSVDGPAWELGRHAVGARIKMSSGVPSTERVDKASEDVQDEERARQPGCRTPRRDVTGTYRARLLTSPPVAEQKLDSG